MPNRLTSRSIISCDQTEYYIRKRLLRTVSGTDQDADWMREAFFVLCEGRQPAAAFFAVSGAFMSDFARFMSSGRKNWPRGEKY